jgi:hypothetical protein
VRVLAVFLAAAYLATNAFTAFLLIFLATFPFENLGEAAADDWLIGVAIVLVSLALAVVVAVAYRRPDWAIVAYGVAPPPG